jgi:SAM-dependent methyltransferase
MKQTLLKMKHTLLNMLRMLHGNSPTDQGSREIELSDSAVETLRPLLPDRGQGYPRQVRLDDLILAVQRIAKASSPSVIRNLHRSSSPPNPIPALADYQETTLQALADFIDVREKTILEVGSDIDGSVLYELGRKGASFVLGVDDYAHLWQQLRWVRLLSPNLVKTYGDIRSLPYMDDSFDLILNIATFEHIHALPDALLQMHRLLKPGGMVYAQFGPLWSSAVGHHIWCEFEELTFRFNDPAQNPLDDFDHLLYDREELALKLAASWDPKIVDLLIYSVFDHPHINREFHHEICGYARQSPFEVVTMEKSWDIPVSEEVQTRLRERHGQESDYSCAGMKIVLKKEP